MNLTDPSLVLSVFVRMLGGSNMLIGLLPTIRFGGWFLPQFMAASWIQPQEPHTRVMGGYDQLWDGPSLSLIS
jgi:hypothetical protein